MTNYIVAYVVMSAIALSFLYWGQVVPRRKRQARRRQAKADVANNLTLIKSMRLWCESWDGLIFCEVTLADGRKFNATTGIVAVRLHDAWLHGSRELVARYFQGDESVFSQGKIVEIEEVK